ncbi:hypothetical protein, partial [Salmonella sp. s58408]|uniref:hypothetical protein n=1 Tax=Salmonella sp. s58408 TaxID=3159701 RepID=UPI00397FC98F
NGCDLDDIPCYGTVAEDEIQAVANGASAGKTSSSGLLLLASASAAAAAAAAVAATAALV